MFSSYKKLHAEKRRLPWQKQFYPQDFVWFYFAIPTSNRFESWKQDKKTSLSQCFLNFGNHHRDSEWSWCVARGFPRYLDIFLFLPSSFQPADDSSNKRNVKNVCFDWNPEQLSEAAAALDFILNCILLCCLWQFSILYQSKTSFSNIIKYSKCNSPNMGHCSLSK